MRQSKIICVSVLVVTVFFSPIQNCAFGEDTAADHKLNKDFFVNFTNDLGKVLVSPVHWKKKDLFTFSAVLGAGCLLYAVDEDLQHWVQDNKSSTSSDFFEFITHFGDGRTLLGLIAVMYTTGELFHDKNLRKTALLGLESWMTAGIINMSLKAIIGRARPSTSDSSCSFRPFSTKSSYFSLPSGHSVSAFAVATVIADRSKSALIDILSYSLATMVALSRVHNNNHWASDVFIGSSLGYFVAKKILLLNHDRNSRKVNLNFRFSAQSQALSLVISF